MGPDYIIIRMRTKTGENFFHYKSNHSRKIDTKCSIVLISYKQLCFTMIFKGGHKLLALDHIVINSTNTNDIITHSGMNVAFKAVKGGEHDDWGTYNYLSHFSNNSYLELLGVNDYNKAEESTNPLIQHLLYMQKQGKTGPFQFALRTKQLDSYVTHFNKEGIPYKGPFSAQREKPDGTIIKWRMLFPVYDFKRETMPFLIEWEDPKAVFSETNLANTQSITRVNYGSLDKPTFARIYQLKPKKLNKHQITLLNSMIYFTDNQKITFELV